MKKTLGIIVLLLTAFCTCSLWAAGLEEGKGADHRIPAHPSDLKFSPLDYEPPKAADYRHEFDNGALAFLVEDHELPLVNVSVQIRAGGYLDPEGKAGLASFVGNQLRAGGTEKWDAETFDEEADFLAANISSFMRSTSGRATVNFLAKDIDQALEMFFQMLRHPAFQQDRLDLYKSQSLQRLERRNDSTGAIERREWGRLLDGDGHFSTRQVTKSSLDSISRDDLLAFHKRYYHPANFIFAVSGDFDSADMKGRLAEGMKGWAAGERSPAIPAPHHEPVPGVYMVHKQDVNQGRVAIGHKGIKRGNPDQFAIEMMNDILGGSGFTSRITNRVRSDEGLAYSAFAFFPAGISYKAVFRAGFQSKSPTCAQAAQIVLEEINRIRDEKVSPEELETVKNSAIESFTRRFSSAGAVAATFASDERTGNHPMFWQTYRDKIRAVTVEDVQRVARQYLHPDRMVILAVGNVDDMLKGNPDKPEYKFSNLGEIHRIPLPDPLTMEYPPQ